MATSTRSLKKQITALKKQVKALKADNARKHATIAQDNEIISVFVPETLMLERVVELTGYSLDEGTYHDGIYDQSADLQSNYASADEWVDSYFGSLPFTSVDVHPTSVNSSSTRRLSMVAPHPRFDLNYLGAKKK